MGHSGAYSPLPVPLCAGQAGYVVSEDVPGAVAHPAPAYGGACGSAPDGVYSRRGQNDYARVDTVERMHSMVIYDHPEHGEGPIVVHMHPDVVEGYRQHPEQMPTFTTMTADGEQTIESARIKSVKPHAGT